MTQISASIFGLEKWYHHLMSAATALAYPNIAFIKCRLAKRGRTNRKVRFRAGYITGGSAFCGENQNKTDSLKANGQV
jgi:hypothetical protein